MRLWHYKLLQDLPRQQLLGQHRECCALRGLGWGKRHAIVDYVFKYSPYKLYTYHAKVMEEMARRGYQADPLWKDAAYRGKNCAKWETIAVDDDGYQEHDDRYLTECLDNLERKGIIIFSR